jgi:hypothetical protein
LTKAWAAHRTCLQVLFIFILKKKKKVFFIYNMELKVLGLGSFAGASVDSFDKGMGCTPLMFAGIARGRFSRVRLHLSSNWVQNNISYPLNPYKKY